MTKLSYLVKQNSTLGSVVPLAMFLTFLVICGHWTITYTNDESECCDGDEKDYIGDNHDTQYEQGVPRRIHETIKSLILKDATL